MNTCEPATEAPAGAGVASPGPILPDLVRQVSVRLAGEKDDDRFAAIDLPDDLSRAVPKRRLQFRAGRYCALEALRALAPELQTAVIPRGVRGVPVWPDGIVGSITHTSGFASAAVARTSRIVALGIDTEVLIPTDRARSLAHIIARPPELALARAEGYDEGAGLTLVFSAKESIFKCLYPLVGVWFGFHDVCVEHLDAGARRFRARTLKALSDRVPADTMLEGRFEVEGALVHTGLALAFDFAQARAFDGAQARAFDGAQAGVADSQGFQVG